MADPYPLSQLFLNWLNAGGEWVEEDIPLMEGIIITLYPGELMFFSDSDHYHSY